MAIPQGLSRYTLGGPVSRRRPSAVLRRGHCRGRRFSIAAFTILCLVWLPWSAPAAEVAVLLSANVEQYRDAVRGFAETLEYAIVADYDMDGDFNRGRRIVAEIQRKVRPDLVLAVGVWALELIVRENPGIPVVYTMVLNPQSVIGDETRNITGASMNVPVERSVRVLRQLSPELHRVGIVFDAGNTGYLVKRAKPIARARGLQLISREVRSSGEAVTALDSLQREGIHALWILPDKTILAPVVLEHMLLLSYRKRIPILGFASRHAQMGALVTLSFASSEDIGRQAGELANRILGGSKASDMPYTTARQVALSVNLKTAAKLGMIIPADLLASANEVIR